MRSLAALFTAGALVLQPSSAITIDHILLGIADLERGIAEFEQKTGVKPVFGGVHPGRGTQNALASLGNAMYVEVIALDPKQTSVTTPMVEGLGSLTSLQPVGWALHAADLAVAQKQLAANGIRAAGIRPGSRSKPDGSLLEWSTMNIVEPPHRWMPFLIRWADPSKQPATTSPTGCTLASIEIEDASPAPLKQLVAAARIKVDVNEGTASRMRVTLDCPRGRVSFS